MVEQIVIVIASLVVGMLLFMLGWYAHKRASESKLMSTEKLAEKMISEAKKEAETHKKGAVLEAKDQWYKAKEKFERETQARKSELSKLERRFSDREANLNRKVDILDKKEGDVRRRERDVASRDKALTDKESELQRLVEEENRRLEKIAGMTSDEAKQVLITNLESEAKHEAAHLIRRVREEAERKADKEAREILTLAIQRCAADHVVESTVSVVSLPNEEMKGRIIGREGRNIRAFELSTGIDVIIDDTPEAVILSGFDPIRREVAKISLERLVADGRIHPARIEEVVAKVQAEMDEKIREVGEQVSLDVGVHGLHPELIKMLGRLQYRTSYGQNVLQHSKEVAYLSGMMASELGFDSSLAKRAGLLHDIGKAIDHETEGTHTQIGSDVAERYGENPAVVHAIGFHHSDSVTDSANSVLVQAADAVSSARPGARRETLESYVKRLEKLEKIADSFKGVTKAFAIQAGREIRIMVESKEVNDDRAEALAQDIARKVEKELEYPGQVKVVVIRETRAIEYAK
ncbi:MAG: ribonuclease Y [Candidatus Eisenbacteria bacterium]